MNKIIIIIVGVLIVLVLGFIFISSSKKSTPSQDTNMMQQPTGDQMRELDKEGYVGKVLSGSSSPFLEFTKEDYEKAKAEGKVILLDFYATWCPICRAEEPEINEGFNALTTNQVVGFRVNFNDPDTDDDERALAKEFNIPYQHTKVIVVSGKEVSRSSDTWEKEDLLNAVNSALK